MPQTDGTQRKIIHIDMDAFYASVEQRDNPALRGKAIAVGGSPEGRGVVMTASYEARKFGVHSAMASKTAIRLCPNLLFVPPRFSAYKEASMRIHEIFHRHTDIIEPLSLDEAYLDVSKDKQGFGSAIEVAKQIRQAIKEELELTASAGVSVNKFVAKIASDLNKPDGLAFIGPSVIKEFMEKLAVEKFYGVGKVTADKMKGMGLNTGADLKRLSEEEMVRHFGKIGFFYYKIVRGIDEREVQTNRETKSISAEDTFREDTSEPAILIAELERLAIIVSDRVQRSGLRGRTVTIKIKYGDFKQITRNHSVAVPISDAETIAKVACMLLEQTLGDSKAIRLLGVGLANFGELIDRSGKDKDASQLELFQ